MIEIQSNQPSAIPSWVLLDQSFLYKDPGSFRADGKISAETRGTTGEPVRVSFDLHAPPGSSRLCLYCPEERRRSGWNTVVAAHGDALLFSVEVDVLSLPLGRPHATDYFIYRAYGSSSGPALSVLPRCYSTAAEVMAEDAASWRSKWRMATLGSIGLLLAGDQDFVVAELEIDYLAAADRAAPLEAELFRLHATNGGGGQWELTRATSRGGKISFKDILEWETHRVVPFTSYYLCWVDYYQGVLFCDVCNNKPELQYLPFPVRGDPGYTGYAGAPELSRIVCITKGETMKFVDVVRGSNDRFSCPACNYRSGFTIIIWTLRVINDNDMEWVEDFVIEADELWSMEGYDHGQLPCFVPRFPLVSMDDPHILYFVLSNTPTLHDEQTWIVTLDMESKKILRYDDIKAFPSDNIFSGFGFFPTNFSNYLKKARLKEGEEEEHAEQEEVGEEEHLMYRNNKSG